MKLYRIKISIVLDNKFRHLCFTAAEDTYIKLIGEACQNRLTQALLTVLVLYFISSVLLIFLLTYFIWLLFKPFEKGFQPWFFIIAKTQLPPAESRWVGSGA